MKSWSTLLIVALLAGCDKPHEALPTVVDVRPIEPLPPREPTAGLEPAWPGCPTDWQNAPAYFGNRWWGELTLCTGDIRVVLRADSVALGGPGLGAVADTKECFGPDFDVANGGDVGPSFFMKDQSGQVAEVRELVRKTVLQVKPACGGPYDFEALFDDTFEKRFAEFAEKYWRNIPSDELSAALARQQQSRSAD